MTNIDDSRAGPVRCPHGHRTGYPWSPANYSTMPWVCSRIKPYEPVAWYDHGNSTDVKFLRALHSALRARNRTGDKNRTGPMVRCDWGISWVTMVICGPIVFPMVLWIQHLLIIFEFNALDIVQILRAMAIEINWYYFHNGSFFIFIARWRIWIERGFCGYRHQKEQPCGVKPTRYPQRGTDKTKSKFYQLPHWLMQCLADDVIKWKQFPRNVTGPMWGESTGHWWISLTKAGDAEQRSALVM